MLLCKTKNRQKKEKKGGEKIFALAYQQQPKWAC
jgi:hypothetical protein